MNITRRAVLALLSIAAVSVSLSGCGTPKNLDLSLDKPSDKGTYRVALEPPVPAPGVNRMHSWRVRVAAPTGEPVQGARISAGGGMPQHGHGFPTQPRVTREVEAGVYLLEGVKFSMPGWWDIKLDIDAAAGADKVAFNTIVQTARQE